ncbi:MAG: tetratricopeptide repeat protein [Candidatus Sulfotelmatobacter sp.]|jgi:Flp pilus assembly protein TadD
MIPTLLRLVVLLAVSMGTPTTLAQRSPSGGNDSSDAASQLDPILLHAKSLLENASVPEAERLTRSYLESHPTSADAHFLLGLILFKEVRAKESLAEYTTAARYRDPSAYELEMVALNYVLLNDYMDADKWLSKSVQMDSHNWESWYYLGRTKYNENRFNEAVNAFQQALKLSPMNVKAEDNLGLSYDGLGRQQEAEEAYRKAIRWQSQLLQEDPGPYLDLGILLIDRNRPQDAIPYLRRASQISPHDPKAHEQLGKAYAGMGRLPEAQVELEKAVEASPNDGALHYVLGQIYRREGMKDKAQAEFEKLAALKSMQGGTQANGPADAASRH